MREDVHQITADASPESVRGCRPVLRGSTAEGGRAAIIPLIAPKSGEGGRRAVLLAWPSSET